MRPINPMGDRTVRMWRRNLRNIAGYFEMLLELANDVSETVDLFDTGSSPNARSAEDLTDVNAYTFKAERCCGVECCLRRRLFLDRRHHHPAVVQISDLLSMLTAHSGFVC
jgi:hypothetical protein